MKIQTLGLVQPEKRGDANITNNNESVGPLNNPAVPLAEAADWLFLGGGAQTDAGEFVGVNTALQLNTIFSCVKILAESVSSLPLQLFKRTDKGNTLELDHPLSYLLGQQPNLEMDTTSWLECMMSHLVLTGNCYSQIQRGADGTTPIALWPLSPRLTVPYRLDNNVLVYKTDDAGVSRYLPAKDVFHVKTFAYDGLLGMSPILQNKRLLGSQMGAEKFGSRFFANNATPSLVLKNEAKIKPEDKHKMRRDFEALQSGVNQHRVAVLDQNTSIEKLSITNDEAQYLELMQFNRASIGAMYRISSHQLGSETRQTDSNVEAMNRDFVTNTIRPYLTKFASQLALKILPHAPGKISAYSVAFNLTEMLKGDSAAQSAWAQAGANGGWLTGNDIRRFLGLNEAGPELDVFRIPVNYQAAERLLDAPAPTPKSVTEQVVANV